MSLTRISLQKPAGVAVGVAIVLVFGLYSLAHLPVQLFPDIERPQISVSTNWRAASPREIEAEILEPQEDVLQGLAGLKEMESQANAGGSFIKLVFGLETDMQKTLIDVISRLNRIPPLPTDADPPVIQLGGGDRGGSAGEELIWFYVQVLPGNPKSITDFQHMIEDRIEPRFSSIPGVAGVEIFAGAPEEIQIRFDPFRAADLGIEIPRVAALAGRANDVSGGFVEVGRRQYTLRFAGRYSPDELEDLVVEWRQGRPVRLGDIAEIRVARGEQRFFTLQNGNPAMALRLDRESGANVLATLERTKQVAAELNAGILAENGLNMQPSFFAVGMVLDAAIVVLENIVRLREEGEAPDVAAEHGTTQVWGALLASTATTVAIFLPVIFLKDVEGQLFADLALTIAIAVMISLLVAVTILPTAARRFLARGGLGDHHAGVWDRLTAAIIRWTDSRTRRALWITGLMILPVAATLLLFPRLDYLPPVLRDSIDTFLTLPPGADPRTVEREILQPIVERLRPYMDGEREPALRNYFAFIFPSGGIVGVRAKDQRKVDELMRLLREEIMVGFPDLQAFTFRGNLFGGFESNRSIAMHLQGSDTEALLAAARRGAAGCGWANISTAIDASTSSSAPTAGRLPRSSPPCPSPPPPAPSSSSARWSTWSAPSGRISCSASTVDAPSPCRSHRPNGSPSRKRSKSCKRASSRRFGRCCPPTARCATAAAPTRCARRSPRCRRISWSPCWCSFC